MMCIRLVTLICLLTADIQATSHWMVTETGLIQPKENSPFLMENSFDLISFLNQDIRWENIFIIYHNLIQSQRRINKYWYELQVAAEMPKHLAANEHCNQVPNIEILDWYTSFMEDGKFKGIQDKEFLIQNYEKGNTKVPDCKKISSLTFSMFAFEHLEGMVQRQSLNATPEFALPELFAPIMTVDQFGHWLSETLRKNSSSWLHYNLAAIYWRVKGNSPKAIECSRRAVHYAPRRHKSIPLLCLGTILHRSQRPSDAIVVLGAAVEHDPGFPIAHFALGLAYAVRGDFYSSLKHLDISIQLHGKFTLAMRFRHAILCHIDMRAKIDVTRKYVKRLVDELESYTKTEMIWLRIQTAFLKTMKQEEKYDYLNMDYNLNKMSLLTGLKITDLKREAEKYSLLQYFFDEPQYKSNWCKERGVHSIITALGLYRAIKYVRESPGFPPRIIISNIRMNKTKVSEEIGPLPALPGDMFVARTYLSPASQEQVKHKLQNNIEHTVGYIDTGVLEPETAEPLYPPNMKVDRNREEFDREGEWPSQQYCQDNVPQAPHDLEAIYPVFMPFENKGYNPGRLLTERLGVPALVEMELPWHPPVCPPDAHASAILQKKGLKVRLVNETLATQYFKSNLMKYVSDVNLELLKRMQDAEIGQRIHTAITKKIAPMWVLYSVAALYWRARRHAGHAAACLAGAARAAPTGARDAPLVAQASLYLDLGLLQDAAAAAEEAYRINPYEPATNFMLAQVSMVKKDHRALLVHLKQTVRVEPLFLNGVPRRLLSVWACLLAYHGAGQRFEEKTEDKQFCEELQSGMTMVCERDGTNCRFTHRDCTAVHTLAESESALVRMLELQQGGDAGGGGGGTRDEVDGAAFDGLVRGRPRARRDLAAHRRHYRDMLRTVHTTMRGCGARGCREMRPEDLELKEEDCFFQHLQLDYWLHLIFREVLSESDINLPAEILSSSISSTREPACGLPADHQADFFVSRVLGVDTEGWEPLLGSMQQFSDIFDFYDYSVLGTKIANYVDTKPTSWAGLVAGMWWCGASGRGACAVRCAAAALARCPLHAAHRPLRPLAALLHMQSKKQDAKDIAYLSFYMSPKNKIEAFLVAVSHTYTSEFEQAVWMYRYALVLDEKFLPAKACLHITMCLMLFKDSMKKLHEKPA